MTKQDKGEVETRKSLAEGHGITFPNAEEAIKWLKGEKMTRKEKNDLVNRLMRYAFLGWTKKEAIQRCVNVGYKRATVLKYYKIFVESMA